MWKWKMASLMLSGGLALVIEVPVNAAGDLVRFPSDFAEGVHYTTVDRGNVKEEIYANRVAAEAAKNGRPLPSGSVITLVEYKVKLDESGQIVRDAKGAYEKGELSRYIVMEKRAGWGQQYSAEQRNGEWEYQSFRPDRTVNTSENVARCMACHKSQAKNDYVFTAPRLMQK